MTLPPHINAMLDNTMRNIHKASVWLQLRVPPAFFGIVRQQLAPALKAAYLRGRLSRHKPKPEDFEDAKTSKWNRTQPYAAVRVRGTIRRRDDISNR